MCVAKSLVWWTHEDDTDKIAEVARELADEESGLRHVFSSCDAVRQHRLGDVRAGRRHTGDAAIAPRLWGMEPQGSAAPSGGEGTVSDPMRDAVIDLRAGCLVMSQVGGVEGGTQEWRRQREREREADMV